MMAPVWGRKEASMGHNPNPMRFARHGSIALLGAMDPEMALIRAILGAAGVPTLQATDGTGRPVTPGGAYQAPGYAWGDFPPGTGYPGGGTVSTLLRVECDGPAVASLEEEMVEGGSPALHVVVIDHHRPGDPGHGRPAAEAWEASSLGQVVTWLLGQGLLWEGDGGLLWAAPSLEGPAAEGQGTPWLLRELRAAGAQDHDAPAALQGRVPGVDPATVRALRTRNACGFLRLTPEEYEAEVSAAGRALRSAPCLNVWQTCPYCAGTDCGDGGDPDASQWARCSHCERGLAMAGTYRDLRPAGPSHRLTAEAALRLGEAYLADVEEVARGEGGRPLPGAPATRKAVVGGCASPAVVRQVLAQLADEGLVRPYDTGRGMAGAYYP